MIIRKDSMNNKRAISLWEEKEKLFFQKHEPYYAHPEKSWIDPFRIIGNVYFIGDRVVAPYLIDTGEGLMLLDTGYPHAGEMLKKSIAQLGFHLKDITYILHSHEHFDHFGITRELQETYGCKAFIHELGAKAIRETPEHTHIKDAHWDKAELFTPDETFTDGDVIELGNMKITCIHTPGHSAGATTFTFPVEENGTTYQAGVCGVGGFLVLHTGRLLKYNLPMESREQYLQSIEKIQNLPIDITLDAHPRPNGVLDRRERMLKDPNTNPYIDQSAWKENLSAYKERFKNFIQEEQRELNSEND